MSDNPETLRTYAAIFDAPGRKGMPATEISKAAAAALRAQADQLVLRAECSCIEFDEGVSQDEMEATIRLRMATHGLALDAFANLICNLMVDVIIQDARGSEMSREEMLEMGSGALAAIYGRLGLAWDMGQGLEVAKH